MSAALTFAPSKGVLRLLSQLALAGSTIGAFGGFVSVHHAIYRQTQCLEKALEQKRLLQSLSSQNSAAHLSQLFQEAEAGQLAGLKSSRKSKVRSVSQAAGARPLPIEPSPKVLERSNSRRTSQFKKPLSPSASAAQRIIDSTLQQHKPQSYTVYGRPRNQRPEMWGRMNSSIEKVKSKNRIAEASLLPLKSSQHQVHWRPRHHSTGGSPTLAECVDLWLRSKSQRTSTATSNNSTDSSSFKSPLLVRRVSRRPSLGPNNPGSLGNSSIMNPGLKPSSQSFATLSQTFSAATLETKDVPIMTIFDGKPRSTHVEKGAIASPLAYKHEISIKVTRSGEMFIRYQSQT